MVQMPVNPFLPHYSHNPSLSSLERQKRSTMLQVNYRVLPLMLLLILNHAVSAVPTNSFPKHVHASVSLTGVTRNLNYGELVHIQEVFLKAYNRIYKNTYGFSVTLDSAVVHGQTEYYYFCVCDGRAIRTMDSTGTTTLFLSMNDTCTGEECGAVDELPVPFELSHWTYVAPQKYSHRFQNASSTAMVPSDYLPSWSSDKSFSYHPRLCKATWEPFPEGADATCCRHARFPYHRRHPSSFKSRFESELKFELQNKSFWKEISSKPCTEYEMFTAEMRQVNVEFVDKLDNICPADMIPAAGLDESYIDIC